MTKNPVALDLYKASKKLADEGKGLEQLALLEEIIGLEPLWVPPIYDLAFYFLLQQEFEKSLEYYKKVDEIEPTGYFNTKTAIWGLQKEQSENFPKGLYIAYAQTEWLKDQNRKLYILKEIVDRFPSYAPAWRRLANELVHPNDRLAAVNKGLECLDVDLETSGGLLITKAIVTRLLGDATNAKNILHEFLKKTNTSSNREIAEFLLNDTMHES